MFEFLHFPIHFEIFRSFQKKKVAAAKFYDRILMTNVMIECPIKRDLY